MKSLLKLLVYIIFLCAVAYYIYIPFQNALLDSLFLSGAILISSMMIVSLAGRFISRTISDKREQYELNKVSAYIFYSIAILLLILLWVPSPETIIIGLGIVGAGLVVVFQEPILSVGGFVYIAITRLFVVGDRIEIGDLTGDVIDVSLFNTKIMEIKGWVQADQISGRLVVVPNHQFFKQNIYNYTRDFDFIWDELQLPLTYESDWQKAIKISLSTAKKIQKSSVPIAKKEMTSLSKKYFFNEAELAPKVYVQFTDNWVKLSLRYVTPVKERRELQSKLSTDLLKKFEKEKDIEVASKTSRVFIEQGNL